jgi:hypothetical protein
VSVGEFVNLTESGPEIESRKNREFVQELVTSKPFEFRKAEDFGKRSEISNSGLARIAFDGARTE